MKALFLNVIFLTAIANAAEIVDVRNQIPMSNDAPRVKDYYLSTDGAQLKKDLVIKIVRKVNISQGKKNIGEINAEIGLLRILSVADKVAVAREYKLNSTDQAPLTESIGFMVGDQVDMTGSFTDSSKRKPNSESEFNEMTTPSATAPIIPNESDGPSDREPRSDKPAGHEAHVGSQKIEIKMFPDKI